MAVTVGFLLLSASLLIFAISPSADVGTDTATLDLFRNQTDVHGMLLSNWTTSASASSACAASWRGVDCSDNRVAAVSLPFLNLRGPIDALFKLNQLRVLDLSGNRLNGSLTPIAQCLNLERINLSGNDFSDEIPPEFSSLGRLLSLDLSSNNLRGSVPAQFSNLSRLGSLQLQNNQLSGTIPNFLGSLLRLRKLNLSNNELYGMLPNTLLSRFGLSSFSGNEGLCGFRPYPNCSSSGEHQPPSPELAPSAPKSAPPSTSIEDSSINHHSKLSTGDTITISGVSLFLLVVMALFAVWFYSRNSSNETNSAADHSSRRMSAGSDNVGNNARNAIVFFDRAKQFAMEDLLQAPAEMIGKGCLGTVYKAVLGNGLSISVKRLRDENPCPRRVFEQYMNAIGRLRHINLVNLIGYFNASEEKLLLFDYMPNGSLRFHLHENRRNRRPLDWTTRISLILGAARGLARIHSITEIPHGNVKSSNVLLDKNGMACVSDFALAYLLQPSEVISKMGGYRAPEQVRSKKHSLKADVYSFGVLLLEVLTGRDPLANATMDLVGWVRRVAGDKWTPEVVDPPLLRYKNVEGEMVALLHVAMACVEPLPQKRPEMEEVLGRIQEIRAELSPYSGSRTPEDAAMA